ncbi:MAG: ROK family transcriptional regulator [Spirochaetes bacterium]|nr:ROK family transcriptional regulator [Spirochaetota bacterium]
MTRETGTGMGTAFRIIKTIWHHPRISRVKLAERLGLDKSTITNQVSRLIEYGIIEEIDEGEASTRGGRKPIHLVLDRNYGRVIGIEIQVNAFIAVAVDLSGEVLAEHRGSVYIDGAQFAGKSCEIISDCVAKLCPSGERLLGVGVGMGGLIDSKRNVVNYSVPLAIASPIDFGVTVAAKLDVPCFVENDANCCAWGELAFNRREELKDFLFALVEFRTDPVSIGEYGGMGVGFGIVLGGKVFTGAHGNAGEFRSVLCDGSGNLQFSLPKETIRSVERDSIALSAVTDELARNMAMFLNVMDFEHVFIGGDIERLDSDFCAQLRRRLEENWMYPVPRLADIRYSSLGGRAVAYGAAGMLLDRLLTGRHLSEGSSRRSDFDILALS